MAMHHDLPLYRATYQFILSLYEVTRDYPREYKYTIGQDMKRDTMELVRLIICANKDVAGRVAFLTALQEKFEVVRMQIRLCFDLWILTIRQHSSLSDKMENISKQINGWKKASENVKG